MANARITAGIASSASFERQVKRIVAAKSLPKLERVVSVAQTEFDRIVAAEFVNDRSPDRRRGGRHLLGSSYGKVQANTTSGKIGTVEFGSNAPGKKLGALNYGSPPHSIDGDLVFPVAQRWSKGGRKARVITKQTFTPRQNAYLKNGAGSKTVSTDHVDHPGNAPHYMLQRALEFAVRSVFRQTINLKR